MKRHFMICVDSHGYEASLEVRKNIRNNNGQISNTASSAEYSTARAISARG
jgi:hypothetical protein